MATNPYRDFGLHPDEFGTARPGSTAPQPNSAAPQPLSDLPTSDTPKPSGRSFNWGRVGMVLLAIVVVGLPKAFMHNQRQARQRADRDRARQMQPVRQVPQAQVDNPARQAQVDKAVRQLNADVEAVRSGKKKAGEAFYRMFDIPQTPENTIKLPAAKAAAKEGE